MHNVINNTRAVSGATLKCSYFSDYSTREETRVVIRLLYAKGKSHFKIHQKIITVYLGEMSDGCTDLQNEPLVELHLSVQTEEKR